MTKSTDAAENMTRMLTEVLINEFSCIEDKADRAVVRMMPIILDYVITELKLTNESVLNALKSVASGDEKMELQDVE
jgi:hypothetical protein